MAKIYLASSFVSSRATKMEFVVEVSYGTRHESLTEVLWLHFSF